MRDLIDEANAEFWCGNAGGAVRVVADNPRCISCESTNTKRTGMGGYQAPDPSKGAPGGEGDEYGCNDCGRCFIW